MIIAAISIAETKSAIALLAERVQSWMPNATSGAEKGKGAIADQSIQPQSPPTNNPAARSNARNEGYFPQDVVKQEPLKEDATRLAAMPKTQDKGTPALPAAQPTEVRPDKAASLNRGDVFIDNDCRECPKTAPEMVVIEAGKFKMGDDYNLPIRDVEVRKFAIGKYEVTFNEFDACFNAGGCRYKPNDENWGREKQPVINVNFEDAKDYAQWLSKTTGRTYRLPSEAEWEYAARSGSKTRFWNGVELPEQFANCYNCGNKEDGEKPIKVGTLGKPNNFGLHDMHGNVAEWVEDCYNRTYDRAPTNGSAWKSGDCNWRGVRGGSYYNWQKDIKSAARSWEQPLKRDKRIGFRVAREISEIGASASR